MIIGTTPTHYFDIGFDTEIVKKLRLTYAQDDFEIVEKDETQCTYDGTVISTELSQEDTLAFEVGKDIEIQLRILTEQGAVITSNICTIKADKSLNREVLA